MGWKKLFLKKKYIELLIEICNGGVGFFVCSFVCFCYCWVFGCGFLLLFYCAFFFLWAGGGGGWGSLLVLTL